MHSNCIYGEINQKQAAMNESITTKKWLCPNLPWIVLYAITLKDLNMPWTEISNECLQIIYCLPKNNNKWINNYSIPEILKNKSIPVPSVFLKAMYH